MPGRNINDEYADHIELECISQLYPDTTFC